MSGEKDKALDMALNQIERQFGKGAIMRLGSSAKLKVDVIPTGAIGLDAALGVGGIPRGRIAEIYGPEASGKTTLALHVVAEAQRLGGAVAYIDAEHALDPTYAKAIGVDIDELLISQPDTGEQALDICEMLVRSGAIEVVVIDSVAALTPKAEIEGEMGDHHVGLQARLMSQAMRKLTAAVSKSRCVIIFINQIRMKIGVLFGNPETTTGGNALKFYSTIRLEVRRTESLKKGAALVGARTRAKIVKNKVAPPFRETMFDIVFGKGINKTASLLDCAVDQNIVDKSGSWYSYKGEKIGQGRESSCDFLEENRQLLNEIDHQTRVALGLLQSEKSQGDKSQEEKPQRKGGSRKSGRGGSRRSAE